MSSTTSAARPCSFVWYELHTSDEAAVGPFYRNVLGWTTTNSGLPDRQYTIVHAGGTPIGGILERPKESFSTGAQSGWIGYIGVPDVDEFSRQVEQAGGTVHRAAETIPNVGRFAVVADPQGAMFVLFQPPAEMQEPELPKPGTPGTAAWHDLAAIDWQSDFDFYSRLFGWRKTTSVDMGPNGVYQIFSAGAQDLGGMMNRMNPAQPVGWLFYFHVESVAGTISKVKEQGGSITHGPSEVPGGQVIAHCLDPQNGVFGIVGPKA